MEYSNLRKQIVLPAGVLAPAKLDFDDFYAKPLTREDLKADLEAVNSSIDIIQKTRGGSWPEEQLTEDFDLLDLAWHEREFRDGDSFAYAIYSNDNEYVGCFYLYGIGLRTPLNEETIDYEVDASWWITEKAYDDGYYEKVYEALQKWLNEDFAFTKVIYSNKEK